MMALIRLIDEAFSMLILWLAFCSALSNSTSPSVVYVRQISVAEDN
jgi:hypothetical protein